MPNAECQKPRISKGRCREVSAYFPITLCVFLKILTALKMHRRILMEKPYDIQERAFLFACSIVDFCKPLATGYPIRA
jgi:hypothetical protein